MKIFDFEQFTIDTEQATLWQYQNARNIRTLMSNKQTWLYSNHQIFWANWLRTVFDLTTSTPTIFGMEIWSIILNVPLFVPIDEEKVDKPVWGFNRVPPVNDYKNFGDTIAANPGSGNFSTKNQFYSLTVFEQQFLLRVRYFQLTNLGDINDINAFFNHICDGNFIGYTGTIYAVDNLDMTMSYVFTTNDFPVPLSALLNNLNILPRPAGVAIV